MCGWFVDNKPSIHALLDEKKSILFPINNNSIKRNIKYGDTQIKQHSKVKYLACLHIMIYIKLTTSLHIMIYIKLATTRNFLIIKMIR